MSAGKKTLPYPEESVRPLQALRVVVVDGAQAGETVEIEDEGLHIGSAEGNDLRLSEDPTVSRFHVELTRREDGILVQDNGSTNGTFLGQARIERAVVPPGTELRVGRTAIRVEDGTRVSVEIALEEELGALKGTNPSMRKLFARVRKAAASDVPCLLVGESGTGKELFARAVHEHSKRADGPFVVVDCASLTPTLVASELFGHEKGAFTGATTRRRGRFEHADGGTLFLDEISEAPPEVQVKLLRFLQERELERVGSNETIRVDVRVIAATNRRLDSLVEDGAFREDLFYRLAVVQLEVPPLRARKSDVPHLADLFMRRFAEENEKTVHGFTERARWALLAHPWPGNVRELQNALEQAVLLAEGEEIDLDDLPLAQAPPAAEAIRLLIPGVTLAELERFAILETLKAVGGSKSRAAEVLGISRRTIQYRLKEWGLGGKTDEDGEGDDA